MIASGTMDMQAWRGECGLEVSIEEATVDEAGVAAYFQWG
jgi:hypothetical protein